MASVEDQDLLGEYIRKKSEKAFQGLVEAHVDMVYSTALRQLGGDTHLAKDIAQIVFADVAKNPEKISKEVPIAGWLYRHTCFRTRQLIRTEQRRQRREQKAAEMNSVQDHSHNYWQQIAPLLDDALQRLDQADRDAVVLRYFEKNNHRSIGTILGVSEDAAQKRVSRAIARLRNLLSKQEVELSATILSTLLANHSIVAAPTGLAPSIVGAAFTGATLGGISVTNPQIILAMTKIAKIKVTAISSLILGGLVTSLVVQQQRISDLRAANLSLHQDNSRLIALEEIVEELATKAANQADRSALSPEELRELLRLRSEVNQLRAENKTLSRLRDGTKPLQEPNSDPTPHNTGEFIAASDWANVGADQPEATLETFLWASQQQDSEMVSDLVRWQKEASIPESEALTMMMTNVVNSAVDWVQNVKGFTIRSQEQIDASTKRMFVTLDTENQVGARELIFTREEDRWLPLFHAWPNHDGNIQVSMEPPPNFTAD